MKRNRRLVSAALLLAAAGALLCFLAVEVRAVDPGGRQAFELMKEGIKHYNRKEYEAAIDFFRKSLGNDPKDGRTRFFLGMAYYKAGFDENAVFEFGNLLDNELGGGPGTGAGASPAGDELLGNLIRYLSSKQALLQRERKSEDYALGRELKTATLGKYILSKCTGLDVDESGNIYVASFGSKIALKLSQTGKPVLAFSRYNADHGRLYDIAVWSDKTGTEKRVYVSDFSKDAVYIFRDDGGFIASIGGPGFKEGQFYGPTALAVDSRGDLYVIDSGNVRVQKFSKEGDFLLAFGKEGERDEEFIYPSGVAVDPAGRIYVADHGKKTIQLYDGSGNYLGRLEGLTLEDPYGLSIAGQNRLVIADAGRIVVYDLLYSTWTEIGTGGRIGKAIDAKIDRLEQLYAADYQKDSLFQFVPKADKYRNLTVILDRVDTASLPALGFYVSVLDADGLPVYGLEADNFLLKIGEGATGKVDILSNERRNSRLSLLFLVDKSLSMAQYQRDIGIYLEQLLAKVSENDRMAVVNFNADSWIASSFSGSRLRTMDAILEPRYKEGRGFDRAFRRGIDELNKEFFKKAMIVITDGSYTDQSFKNYSLLSCMNYAMNNHIPVYFLNFSGKESETLALFARSTGARQYDVLHSSEFPYLYEMVRGYRSPEYLVTFSEQKNPKLSGLYVNAEAEVNYNGRFGRSRLGAIYP